MIPAHLIALAPRRSLLVALLIASAATGCADTPTAPGAVILDWHRTSALSDPHLTLGADEGPATEETQAGTLNVGQDAIQYTITLEVGDIRSGGGDGLPPMLRGPRRIRVTVDEPLGHVVAASCRDELTLTPAAEGEGFEPDLAATCTIQVAADAVKVFMLRSEQATPAAPAPVDVFPTMPPTSEGPASEAPASEAAEEAPAGP